MALKSLLGVCFLVTAIYLNITKCHSEGTRSAHINGIDTLIVTHQECTECLDAYVVKGKITLPDNVDTSLIFRKLDINLTGNSPFKNLKVGNPRFEGNFEIVGKFNHIDTINPVGSVIAFKVISWKKL
jgi:hypothetical protein